MRRLLSLILIALVCCVSSGCAALSLGPQIKTEYVLVKAGRPFRALKNQSVTGRLLDETEATYTNDITQDVGGWIFMPEEHWRLVQKELEAKR